MQLCDSVGWNGDKNVESTLKMEVVVSFEPFVSIYKIARLHNPEDHSPKSLFIQMNSTWKTYIVNKVNKIMLVQKDNNQTAYQADKYSCFVFWGSVFIAYCYISNISHVPLYFNWHRKSSQPRALDLEVAMTWMIWLTGRTVIDMRETPHSQLLTST